MNAAHHFDWLAGQVSVRDRRVISFHDIDAFARQSLDDREMGLKRGRLVSFKNEGAYATVQLAGQQQTDHGGLDVLLLVLVSVERVSQVLWDVV